MNVSVDIRCPENPTQLFARLILNDDGVVVGYEVACRDCRRKQGRQVLHVYDLTGVHVGTR